MTELEMLNEVCNAYTSDTRATDGYDCQYRTKEGLKCAIGRFLPEEEEYYSFTGTVDELFIEFPELQDTEPFKGKPMWFLEWLQSLHDKEINWIKTGLSIEGKLTANNIKEELNHDKITIEKKSK